MEPDAAFVGAYSGVELDAVAAVYLYAPGVVNLADTECNHALGLDNAVDDTRFDNIGTALDDRFERFEHFFHCL